MRTALWLLSGGALLAVAIWWRRQYTRQQWINAPNYIEAIQAWAPDEPIVLPAIEPLKAKRDRSLHEVKRA